MRSIAFKSLGILLGIRPFHEGKPQAEKYKPEGFSGELSI